MIELIRKEKLFLDTTQKKILNLLLISNLLISIVQTYFFKNYEFK